MGKHLSDFGVGNDFLNYIPNVKTIWEKWLNLKT